jgi:hypothetical protein
LLILLFFAERIILFAARRLPSSYLARAIRLEAAKPEDIAEMRRLTIEALRAGAFGFTTSRTNSHARTYFAGIRRASCPCDCSLRLR